MRKRPAFVAAMAAITLTSLTACGTGTPDAIVTAESPANTVDTSANISGGTTAPAGEAPPTTAEPVPTTEAPPVDLVVESGMTTGLNSIGTRYTSVAAMLTNPNSVAAYDVDVVFNLKDASGVVIDTDSSSVNYIAAGGKRIIAPMLMGFDIPGEPISIEVVAIVADFAEDKGPNGNPAFLSFPELPLTVVSAAIQLDEYDTHVAGQISNPGTEVAEFASLNCVLRAGGAIVGGANGGVSSPIIPGGTVAFKADPEFYPANTDSVECQSHA